MRDTIESYMPTEISLYKARGSGRKLTSGSVPIGIARARVEFKTETITNQDGIDLIHNIICVYFFNDLDIVEGDYLSLERDTAVREIITFNECIIDEGGENYVEAKVSA